MNKLIIKLINIDELINLNFIILAQRMIIFSVIIILILPYSNETKIITTKLFFPSNNVFSFELSLGNPETVVEARIEQTMQISLLSPNEYDITTKKSSNFIQNEIVKITYNPTNVSLYLEDVKFPNDINTKLLFYILPPKNSYDIKKNRFGFSFLIHNKSVSFIHQLYKNNKISNLQYSFEPKKNEEGFFHLGGLPSNAISNTKYYAKLKVNTTYSYWNVNLTKIVFDNYSFVNNNTVYFDVGTDYIYAPEAFYNILESTYFSKYQNDCYKISFLDVLFMYQCNYSILNSLPQFNFVIDDYQFTLDAVKLFTSITEEWVLDFRKNTANNNWIFGGKFVKHYISLFDYKKGTIELYSENNVITFIGKDPNIKYSFTLIMICVIVIMIGILGIIIYQLSKMKCLLKVSIEIKNKEENKN